MNKIENGILAAMQLWQDEHGFLSEEGIDEIAERFGKPANEVYETASFYSMIRLEPAAKVRIEVCHGAPCCVAGSDDVVKALEEAIGIKIGDSKDDEYSLEYTECLGHCGEGPVVLVNGDMYTNVTATDIPEILKGGAR